jgi:hypothetical protein
MPGARLDQQLMVQLLLGGCTRELQEFDGVSSTQHPIYYHQNNAENHEF